MILTYSISTFGKKCVFINLVFVQNLCIFIINTYSIKIDKTGVKSPSNEAVVAPLIFTTIKLLTAEQKKSLDKETPYGYYRENIFNLEEMYLYRSIFNTYIGNYDEAIIDLNKSWKQHFQSKQ